MLDIDRSVAPGKPIKGGINFTQMSAVYRPRFYWAGELLTIAIPDALSAGSRGPSGYTQERSFWLDIDRAVNNVGGRSASIDKPPNLPSNAMN